MAIQFACTSCREAIEVDDDLANRLVACPYCQTTVRAPRQSTFAASSTVEHPAVPQQAARRRTEVPSAWPDRPAPPPFPVLRSNPAGNFGLAAGLLAWGTMIVLSFQLAGLAISQLPESPEVRKPSQPEMADAMEKVFNDPANRARFVTFGGLMLGFALLAVVLSVAGLLRRNARRGTSIAGLIVGGLLVLCFLASMVISMQVPRAG